VVQSVDGNAVDDMQALNYRIATHPAGARVRLAGRNPLGGARVENLSPAAALDLGIDLFSKGVAIVDVDANSLAAAQGFRTGDIILGINGVAVDRVAELVRALGSATRWQIVMERGGRRATLAFAG
jgi:serine protease Do